jgi:hypothetical protein
LAFERARRNEMFRLSRRRGVRQVFVGGRHLGGYDELRVREARGEPTIALAGAPVETAHST